MPANPLRKTHLKPQDRNRFDSASRVVVRLDTDPRKLTKRGRPPGATQLAFAHLRRVHTGPASTLERITEPNMKACEILIANGVTPHIAATMAFGIAPATFNRWCDDGSREDDEGGPKDPMTRAFYERIQRASAVARGDAEERVHLVQPLDFLQRGPAGRTRPGEPGWTPEQISRFTDQTGGGPPRVVLEVTVGGFQTRVASPALPAQTETTNG